MSNNYSLDEINNLMQSIETSYKSQNKMVNNNQKSNEYKTRDDINNGISKFVNFKDQYVHKNNNSMSYIQSSNNFKEHINNNNMQNNKKTEKDTFKQDLRQNINEGMDRFIFGNPSVNLPPMVKVNEDDIYNHGLGSISTEKSKNLYKTEANERLNHYSPLSCSSNIPINLINNSPKNIDSTFVYSPRDMMNNKLNRLTPLSCTTTLKNPSKDNKNIRNSTTEEKKDLQSINNFNYNDVNNNCNNIYTQNRPVITKY